uniref:Uncharacterized protein n=1 Tax=Anopheles dirus TaxID=7168 RepID=A0A182NSQ4_9DIPT
EISKRRKLVPDTNCVLHAAFIGGKGSDAYLILNMVLLKSVSYNVGKQMCIVFVRGVATQQPNGSNSDSHHHSNDKHYRSFANPLVKEDGFSLKVGFIENGKEIMYSIKHFYDDFVGHSVVKEAQARVNDVQHEVSVLLEKRNTSEFEIVEVAKQLATVQAAQHSVTREDREYLELMKTEFVLSSEKHRLDGMVKILNAEHQMLLLRLTHALNDVHAKERQEASSVRLVKLFFTAIVALIGLAGNAGYNHYKDAQVQNHLKQQSTMMKTLVDYVEQERSLKEIDSAPQEKESYHYYTIAQEHANQTTDRKHTPRTTDVALRRISLIDLAKSKLYEAQSFYDEFSGMNEVKVAQNKVIEIQDQLQLVQERRRHILLELTLVRKQLQDIHIELQKAMRGEHRYVELIKQEFDVLAREKEKNQIFQIIDQEERELFSHLTAAVKTSHEKERTQANNVKYWSIIASGVGALLGIVATSINYYFRNTQFETIRKAGEESNRKLVVLEQKLAGLEVALGRMNVEWGRYVAEKRLVEQRRLARAPVESWGGYFRRHTARFFRFFVPKA